MAVIGDSRKFVSALIVPNYEALRVWGASKGLPTDNLETLLANPVLYKMMEDRINALQKGLASYEQIKRFTLLPREFTMESGELTNTLKIKRRVVAERYADLIDKMYSY